MLKKLFQFDLEERLYSFWGSISPVSKKTFLYVFLLVNFIFIWHTLSFIPDDHSLILLRHGITFNFQWWIGRFAGGWLQQIAGGNIFPIFNNVVCYAGLVLTSIYLANYWYIPKRVLCYVLFSLFVILTPYTLSWVYFLRHQTYFWDLFLIMFALTLLLKPKPINMVIASLLFLKCLGTYLAMVQFIFIVVLGRCFLEVIFKKETFICLWKKYYKIGICLFLALCVFFVILFFMNSQGILRLPQRTSAVFPSIEKVIASFYSLVQAELYIPFLCKILLLGLGICIFVYTLCKKYWLAVLLFFAILLTTQLINLFSDDQLLKVMRLRFFYMPWWYGLFFAVLLKSQNFIKNIALVLLVCFIGYFSIQDMNWQKSFYFETKKEIFVWTDIISRIKANPAFKQDKKYDVFLIGNVNYRGLFSKNSCHNMWDHFERGIFSGVHLEDIFNFYEEKSYITHVYNQLPNNKISHQDLTYLLTEAQSYPHPSSVYISGTSIYIIIDASYLNKLRSDLKATVKSQQ